MNRMHGGYMNANPHETGCHWARKAECLAVGGVLALSIALIAAPAAMNAQGTTTRVLIRAAAHDAKIIGSGVGGARITVIDARTGSLLAQGVQQGGTGDTRRIMLAPRERGESVYDTEGAGGFLAELELTEPTLVKMEAEGPLGTPHATQRASKTMIVVPGVDVLGDGVILELHGFTVEFLEPTAIPKELAGEEIPLRARVTMLCGCPTEPGGMWDSSAYQIEARIVGPEGKVLEKKALAFSGETSIYEGKILVPEGDGLTVQVLAMDPERANFGLALLPIDGEGTGQRSD